LDQYTLISQLDPSDQPLAVVAALRSAYANLATQIANRDQALIILVNRWISQAQDLQTQLDNDLAAGTITQATHDGYSTAVSGFVANMTLVRTIGHADLADAMKPADESSGVPPQALPPLVPAISPDNVYINDDSSVVIANSPPPTAVDGSLTAVADAQPDTSDQQNVAAVGTDTTNSDSTQGNNGNPQQQAGTQGTGGTSSPTEGTGPGNPATPSPQNQPS
jgi:hypothetical protein